jgi:hypothetical protein
VALVRFGVGSEPRQVRLQIHQSIQGLSNQ